MAMNIFPGLTLLSYVGLLLLYIIRVELSSLIFYLGLSNYCLQLDPLSDLARKYVELISLFKTFPSKRRLDTKYK